MWLPSSIETDGPSLTRTGASVPESETRVLTWLLPGSQSSFSVPPVGLCLLSGDSDLQPTSNLTMLSHWAHLETSVWPPIPRSFTSTLYPGDEDTLQSHLVTVALGLRCQWETLGPQSLALTDLQMQRETCFLLVWE